MKKFFIPVCIFGFMLILSQCRKPEPFEAEEYDERMSGGHKLLLIKHLVRSPILSREWVNTTMSYMD
jgi:hypothetical protein